MGEARMNVVGRVRARACMYVRACVSVSVCLSV